MADSDEDDYLSAKFLVDATTPATTKSGITYAERRRQAQKAAEAKHEQHRKRSRRELEEAARETQMTSLFERAENEGGSKAMGMMRKMGFKPGQSLGRRDDEEEDANGETPPAAAASVDIDSGASAGIGSAGRTRHRIEPVSASIWDGRKGLGLGKREPSPSRIVSERKAKVARVAAEQEEGHADFRGRAREEWEDRRAEGRLTAARRTCIDLDEKAEVEWNVHWLNPRRPDTFPPGLLDALTLEHPVGREEDEGDEHVLGDTALAQRLRREMRSYRLGTIGDDQPTPEDTVLSSARPVSGEMVAEAQQYLSLPARQRLEKLLEYLRTQYAYCFWCGAQYDDQEDLDKSCPGADEDAH